MEYMNLNVINASKHMQDKVEDISKQGIKTDTKI
jgi:hypothetical protein